MKSTLSRLLLVAVIACAAGFAYSHGVDPGSALMLATVPAAVPGNVMEAFSSIFQPKAQFPRHWQPNPGIGLILVHSQEELDDYESRDWSPKPLPGSDAPPPKLDTEAQIAKAKAELDEQMAKFAEQQAQFFAMVNDKMAHLPKAAAGALGDAMTDMADATATQDAAPSSGAATDPATMVAGLSDASPSDTPEKPHKASKK